MNQTLKSRHPIASRNGEFRDEEKGDQTKESRRKHKRKTWRKKKEKKGGCELESGSDRGGDADEEEGGIISYSLAA